MLSLKKSTAFLIPLLVGAIVLPIANLTYFYGYMHGLWDFGGSIELGGFRGQFLILEDIIYFWGGLIFLILFLKDKKFSHGGLLLLGLMLGYGLSLVVTVFFSFVSPTN
jgi:hypothetical protein